MKARIDIEPKTVEELTRKAPHLSEPFAFEMDFTEEDFVKLEQQARPSKHFWRETRVGRFLSGRTRAGRVARRIGLGALGIGGSLVGIDMGVLEIGAQALNSATSQEPSNLVKALQLIKEILIIVGGMITAVTKTADGIENYGEKADEMENKEGRKPVLRRTKEQLKKVVKKDAS